MTIDKQELDSLPLPGHDLLGLTTVAPGVTGLGVLGSGGNGQSNDNYAATVVGNTGGDYNADGSNSDLPNAPTYGYKIPTSRKS